MFLALGWGSLLWQPIAIQYGKRPVYLIGLLATVGIIVWAPYVETNGQWIANKILQGFFGAPVESLVEISLSDLYFTHERGFYIALYGLFLGLSQFFAPVISGFIADNQGWEWVLYWCAIIAGVAFLITFLFLEETNYSCNTINGQRTLPELNSTEMPGGFAEASEKSVLGAPWLSQHEPFRRR
jgi:MFS family permease